MKVQRETVARLVPLAAGHEAGSGGQDLPKRVTTQAQSPRTLLQLTGVGKTYCNGAVSTPALAHATLHVEEGEMVALMGPSGSGKSTLLNLCGLIDQPSEGRVGFLGEDVTEAPESALTSIRCSAIGFVFQGFNLVPVMTAAENVAYPLWLLGWKARDIASAVARTLAQVDMQQLSERRPDQLSGGQRQRVAIARAIVKRPRLIIADEPTANLDSGTSAQVIDLLSALCHTQGIGTLIATHDRNVGLRCDRLVRVADGRIE